MSNNILTSSRISPLTKEEQELCLKKSASGDMEARNKLIEHNVKLVYEIVNNNFANTPFDKDELISIGIIGLIKAVDTFDVTKNCSFSTYSMKCIKNEILMFLRKYGRISNEISLNQTVRFGKNDDETELENFIEDTTHDLVSDVENKDIYHKIEMLVNELPEKQKYVISLYFGFYGNEIHTQEEIAKEMNISRSYVSRIVTWTLNNIKEKLRESNYIESTKKVKYEKIKYKRKRYVSKRTVKKPNENKNINENLKKQEEVKKIKEIDAKDAVILSLLLGCVDEKCYSIESISKFLCIEKEEVIERAMNALLSYKLMVNNVINDIIEPSKIKENKI